MATISGGTKLAIALAKISANLRGAGTLRVGFLENATYPDGTPVAAVAAWQDFGTGTIPPRPFFRNMVASKSKEWPAAIAGLLPANNYDARRVLDITGAAIAGQLKQAITEFSGVPLAPSTIRRKGHAKALVDSGHMLNSVDHEVT